MEDDSSGRRTVHQSNGGTLPKLTSIESPWQRNNTQRPPLYWIIYSCFLLPLWYFLTGALPHDPSYGRYTLPFDEKEIRIRDNPDYAIRDRRVFIDDDDHLGVNDDNRLKRKRWIWYQSWALKDRIYQERIKTNGAPHERTNSTVVWCHGMGDYSGKFSDHAPRFLEAGYRVVILDFPSHGRSSGLHVYLEDWKALPDALHVLLCDLQAQDGLEHSHWEGGRHYVCGASLGGFTALSYSLLYPETAHALVLLCPLIALSPNSRPSIVVEILAKAIRLFAGRLPLAKANRGNNSDDPRIEEEMVTDPQTYHGVLRVATGLSLYEGMLWLEKQVEDCKVTVPFKVWHGTKDRVCAPAKSQWLYEHASTPSELKAYQSVSGVEHVMLKVGRDEKDDAPRQQTIGEIIEFLRFMDQKPLIRPKEDLSDASTGTLGQARRSRDDSEHTESLRLKGGAVDGGDTWDSFSPSHYRQVADIVNGQHIELFLQEFRDRTLVMVTQNGRVASWVYTTLDIPPSTLLRRQSNRQIETDLDVESSFEGADSKEAEVDPLNTISAAIHLTPLLGNTSGPQGQAEFADFLSARIAAYIAMERYGDAQGDYVRAKPVVVGVGLNAVNSSVSTSIQENGHTRDIDSDSINYDAMRRTTEVVLQLLGICLD